MSWLPRGIPEGSRKTIRPALFGRGKMILGTGGWTDEDNPTTDTTSTGTGIRVRMDDGARRYGYYQLAEPINGPQASSAVFGPQSNPTPSGSVSGTPQGIYTTWGVTYYADLITSAFEVDDLTWDNQDDLDTELIPIPLISITGPSTTAITLAVFGIGGALTGGFYYGPGSQIWSGSIYGFRIRPYGDVNTDGDFEYSDSAGVSELYFPTAKMLLTALS